MNFACCLFLCKGLLLLIGASAFQFGGANNNDRAAPSFVATRISYPNVYNVRPAPHKRHQSPSFSSKLQNDGDTASSLEEEVPSKNLVWLKQRFNFSEEVLTRIADNDRGLLTLDLSVLNDRAYWLQKRLKINDEELGIIIRRFPIILSYRPDRNLGPTLDYLQERLALNTKDLSRLVQKSPSILGYSVTLSLEPKLTWIQNRLYLNETKALQKFVSKDPRMLSCSIDSKLEPTFEWLQERLNLTDSQIAKLCVRAPSILMDGNVRPTLDWLEQRLDLDHIQMGKMIAKAPTISNLRVESLDQKLCWLQKRLCLDDASLKKIITRQPTILSCSLSTNVEPKLQWLQEQLFLADDSDAGKLVGTHPALLGYSIETNLEATLDFFKECIGVDAAVELVVKYPPVLGYSMGKRLRPRLEQAEQLGIQIDTGCLQRMAQMSEERWHKSLTFQAKRLPKSKAKDSLW